MRCVRASALVVVLLVTLSLSAASASVSSAASRLYANPGLDFTLRTPSRWEASARLYGGAVVTSVAVPNRNDNPERIRLPPGGVYIWVFEYRGARTEGIPRRQDGVRLGEKRAHSCGFGEGYMVRFTDRGQLIQAFVKLGPSADGRAALAVLRSLRVRTT
jgi:hypothetical protein